MSKNGNPKKVSKMTHFFTFRPLWFQSFFIGCKFCDANFLQKSGDIFLSCIIKENGGQKLAKTRQ
jgi:hypothetical protein